MIKKLVKKVLPRPFYKTMVRYLKFGSADLAANLLRNRPPLTPPKHMIYTGGTPDEFHRTGNETLEFFKKYGHLKPSHAVLDIGSGIGRMAIPLTRYLDPSAGAIYRGFEIDTQGVRWCEKNITTRFPHFEFDFADIYNKEYNTSGKVKSSEYVFPYPDCSFDFAIANSVFTHMFPEDTRHYLNELGRVLKPHGAGFLTFFLLNPDSKKGIQEGRNTIQFPYQRENFWTKSP
jgi:SAM-dependent methyltransferase